MKTILKLIYLLPFGVLVGSGLLFASAGRDDAHITYWAAYSLSHYGEILNYNGQHVEQSSSLLQVLLLALIGYISNIEIVTLGKVSSVLFGIASLFAVRRLAQKVNPATAFLTSIFTATSAYFVYWSFGGLESTLVAFTALCLIITYAVYLNNSQGHPITLIWSTGATMFFALVRPEISIVLACLLAGAILIIYIKEIKADRRALTARVGPLTHHQIFLSRLLTLFGISLTISALILAFRIWYFASPFPQPVVAKSAGISLDSLREGISYLWSNLFTGNSKTIIGVVLTFSAGYALWTEIKATQVNPYSLLSLLYLGAYILFILLSGGDWMEGGRFLAPVLPVAMMLVALTLVQLMKSKAILILVSVALLGVQAKNIANFAEYESTGMPIWSKFNLLNKFDASSFSPLERANRVNIRDIPTIHQLSYFIERLHDHKRDKVNILSGQMGMVSYHIAKNYFGQIRLTDLHGLADRVFTNCKFTSKLPKRSAGLVLTYSFYFENWETIKECDDVVKPDIIFDIGTGAPMTDVANNGYAIMYVQYGEVTTNTKWFPGAYVRADQFIALRDDLVAVFNEFEPIRVDFSDFQQ